MCDRFNHGVLRVAVAQICQSMGWDSVHMSTHDLLTDVLQKYLQEIGKSAYGYSQLYCRTEPNLDDLGLAFEDVGVPLRELEDYATQVEQAPFIHRLPRYPKLKANALCHPRNGEIVDRLEYYHEHLPPLIKVPPSHQDETTTDTDKADGASPEIDHSKRNGIKTVGEETATESVGLKRPLEEIPAAPGGDAKRRRHESIFKQSKKENGMDILQALQGDVSSPSSTPSPTTVVSFEDKLPDVGGVTKTSTIHRPSSLVLPPAKDNVKMESEPESSVVDVKATVEKSKGIPSDPKPGGPRKNLESPKVPNKPIAKSPKTAKELVKSPSPLKTLPAKSPTPSLKPQTATTVPVKSLPESPKTTPKQKAKTKNSSSTTKKASKAGSIVKGTPVLPAMAVQVKVEEAAPVAPKLVIKPVKQEPGIEARQQAVGQLSSKFPQSSEVHHKKVSKPSQEPAPADKTAGVKTTRPVKSEAGPQNAPLKFTLSQFLSAGSNSSSNVTLIGGMESLPEHKKKKKKHKEKDKDKKHKKVKKESHDAVEFSGIPPIPRLKLKLDAGHSATSSTSVKHEEQGPSGEPSHSRPAASVQPPAAKKRKHVLPATDVFKPEPVERTVITQTLSTTVVSDGRVYICPTCHLPDDGSFMIGCDSCDEWFHGGCVGILQDPGDDMDWFCADCRAKSEKKKKKKKKKAKEKVK